MAKRTAAIPAPPSTTTRVRVAVVYGQGFIRDALAAVVAQWPPGELVLQASDGVDYAEQLATAGPVDLVITGLRMPRRDGFETMAWIHAHHQATRLLALEYMPTDDEVYHALQAHAHGVVGTDIGAKEILVALDAVRTGRYANNLLMRQLNYTPGHGTPLAKRKKLKDTLSPREMVFLLHYVGKDNPSRRKVAVLMECSFHTAETHRRNIAEKTECRTRGAMLMMAIEYGVITL